MWLNRLSALLESEGCRFDSQSGHMPGLWARSPDGGVQEATDQCFSGTCFFPSLSPSLPHGSNGEPLDSEQGAVPVGLEVSFWLLGGE